MSPQSAVEHALPRAIDLRHRLHQIPELMFEEYKTAQAIRGELQSLKIDFLPGPPDAPTATIAMLGDITKPCIALRADIDALPIEEKSSLAYRSKHPGIMHACGHDGHSAILMGATAALKEVIDSLDVCVKLIWQPAEEGGGGGERLVKAGVLDGRFGPQVSAIFGLHGWPTLPVGTVATKPGALLAATDTFAATFVGKGGHAAYPHFGHDPITAAAEAVVNLQQVVSREFDPTDSAVVTIGMFHAGSATNVIPNEATIEGTARSLHSAARSQLHAAIERRCTGIAAAGGCELRFQWRDGYPPTVNDPEMADYVKTIARSCLGPDSFLPVDRSSMGGEDFAYYLEQIPGCFFQVGVQPPGQADYPSLHTDRYDFTDGAMPTGIRMFVELALNFQKVARASRT